MRLIGQLLTEALLLSCAGGAIGAVLAYWVKDALITLLPQSSYRFYELTVDERVLSFAIAASIAAGLMFALLPILHATRRDGAATIGDNVRAPAPQRAFVGRALLVTQVALSVALLVGAGLLIESVRNLQAVDVGFRTDRLLLFEVSPGDQRYDAARTNDFYQRLIDGIAALPGVEGVTRASYPLVGQSGAYRGVAVEGIDSPSVARVGIQRVHHNFFETIGVPILAGRNFDESDRDGGPKAAVINEALAREIAGGDALGRQLFFDFGRPDLDQRLEVVGIVKNVSAMPSRSDFVPVVYLSDRQSFVGGQALSDQHAHGPHGGRPNVDGRNDPRVGRRSRREHTARRFPHSDRADRARLQHGAHAGGRSDHVRRRRDAARVDRPLRLADVQRAAADARDRRQNGARRTQRRRRRSRDAPNVHARRAGRARRNRGRRRARARARALIAPVAVRGHAATIRRSWAPRSP